MYNYKITELINEIKLLYSAASEEIRDLYNSEFAGSKEDREEYQQDYEEAISYFNELLSRLEKLIF